MNKVIGFDIDGVLTDGDGTIWEEELIAYFDLKPETNVNNEPMKVRYNISNDEMNTFFENRSHFVFPQLIMRPGANTLLQELKEIGYTVILITARTISPETPRWLKNNNIPYDLLINQHDKLDPCVANNLQLFVEDTVSNALEISTVMPVLLMNTSYNQGVELTDNIYRMDNFNDIRTFILEYCEKTA